MKQIHFIVPFYYSRDYVKKGLQKVLKKFDGTSAILSAIGMFKMNCITLEKYEEYYKTNTINSEEGGKRISVGDDLETFLGEVKDGKLNNHTIPEIGDICNTFLLCLLDKEERKKLEQKDYDFMRTFIEHSLYGREADVPEAEWKASESNMKFAKSYCGRETFFIDSWGAVGF